MYILNFKNKRLELWINNKKYLCSTLTNKQARLLALLSDRQIHTKEEISNFMWGKKKSKATISRAINSLREKLDVYVKNSCGYWINEEIYIE